MLGEAVGPVLQGLPHHRGDGVVVEAGLALHAFGDEVVPPSPCGASAAQPPPDLTVVIRCASALVKPVKCIAKRTIINLFIEGRLIAQGHLRAFH